MAWFQNLNLRSKVILIFALAPAVTASLDNFTFDRVAVVKNIAGQPKLPASSAATQAASGAHPGLRFPTATSNGFWTPT